MEMGAEDCTLLEMIESFHMDSDFQEYRNSITILNGKSPKKVNFCPDFTKIVAAHFELLNSE